MVVTYLPSGVLFFIFWERPYPIVFFFVLWTSLTNGSSVKQRPQCTRDWTCWTATHCEGAVSGNIIANTVHGPHMGEVTSWQRKVLQWRESRRPLQSVPGSPGAEDHRSPTPWAEERMHRTAWASGCAAASRPTRSPFYSSCTCLLCLANRRCVRESARLLSVLLSAVLQVFKRTKALRMRSILLLGVGKANGQTPFNLRAGDLATLPSTVERENATRSDASGTNGWSARFEGLSGGVALSRNKTI